MVFSLGLGGSASSTSSKSSTSGREAGNELVQRLSGVSTDLTKRMAQLFGAELESPDGLTRDQAIADTEQIVSQIFQNFRESSLPQIFQAQSQTGAFSSTSGQLLANDAYARTVAQGASVVQQAVKDYEQLSQQRKQLSIQGLQTALTAELQGREATTYDTAFKSTTKSKSRSAGAGFSLGL